MSEQVAKEFADNEEAQIGVMVEGYLAAMYKLNEQMARDQKEIERLRDETRVILARNGESPTAERIRLPAAVNERLQTLLTRQDQGETLTAAERKEAEGLVELAELLSLLRLQSGTGNRLIYTK